MDRAEHLSPVMDEVEETKPTENYMNFYDRAEQEADPMLSSDLHFSATIAEGVAEVGGLALVVGGFARDTVIAKHKDVTITSKDIDIEVYGLAFDELTAILNTYGRVDLVGESFGIVKVTNPDSNNALDFSIPRKDSKVDKGHRGFVVSGDPTMSVREAARRRDLTINALAMDPLTGELIDEYGGVTDIKAGLLRATDPELFTDDPLRVLRLMQFAGRFGFKVEPDTANLCRSIDLTELPAERIGEEWVKLMTKSAQPSIGLEVGRELGVLDQLHPELAVLEQIPQEQEWHPEGNVWKHTKHTVDAAARVVREEKLHGEEALIVLFGALCHDLGKATTTVQREKRGVIRWTAHGHEAAGVEPTRAFLSQVNMKYSVRDRIIPIVNDHLYHEHNPEPTDKQLQRFAQRLRPANIRLWDLVCRCDSNGRGYEFESHTPSRHIFERSLELEVAEKPAPPIVMGRDLIKHLNLTPGPGFKPILDFLYDAQLEGKFQTPEDGIAHWRASQNDSKTSM